MKLSLVIVACALLLVACDNGSARPPDIRWQEDVCDYCRMVVEDRRYAAGYRLENGAAHKFDDIGDMVLFLPMEKSKIASIWVRSVEEDRWLPAADAFFVQSVRIESPMGSGLAAVAGRERAEALARETGGEVLTWQQLQERGVKPLRGG
jgi:copper chaperone NosL